MTTTNNKLGEPLLGEGRSIYVRDNHRYVVTLAVGYEADEQITSPEMAVGAALDLVCGSDSDTTAWFVFDRHTNTHHVFDQGEIYKLLEG